jgi:hypothetical protein
MKERSPKPNLDDLEEVKGISVENAFVAEKVCRKINWTVRQGNK